jgi:hypothetical protein
MSTTNYTLPDGLEALVAINYTDASLNSEIIIVTLVLFILSIVLRNYEPLKSRGIIPPIALFIMLVSNATRLAIPFTSALDTAAIVPIQIASLTMVWGTIIITNLRYMVKIRLESLKQSEDLSTRTVFKFANLAVSNWGMLMGMLVLLVIMFFIVLGLYLSIFVTNTFAVSVVAIIITILVIEIVLVVSLVILGLIIDVISYGLCTGTYTLRDPLFFKVDGLFLLCTCIASAVYMVFNLVSQNVAQTQGVTKTYSGLWAACILLEHIERWTIVLASGGSCIAVVAIRAISRCFSKNKDEKLTRSELMLKILRDQTGKRALIKYCEAEFSVENCRAFEDLDRFKEIKIVEEKIKFARYMQKMYVSDGKSLLQVNLSQQCKNQVNRDLENAESNPSILENMFSDFEIEVRGNLVDTFGRFLISEAYLLYQRKAQISAIV